ncbi:MAG: CaiB/BaiF CoA-transferase family protein [Thermoprotei archaeon]
MSAKPLSGIRVVDLSHTLAGPFATMLLADLGAEVIKVEPPHGDETRQWAPLVRGISAYYLSINRGKKSVVVDLTRDKGREIVYKLVARSHIVIENYRPGVREKLGVDPDTLFKYNDKLVYISIKGFRPGSVYEKLPAYDIIVQGMSGIMLSTGFENEPPVKIPFALFDVYTGMLAALNAVVGIYSSVKPYYAEVYLYDTAVFSMCYIPMIYLLTGRKPKRMGHAHPSIVPYQAFRGSDGKWFIVAAANDRFFTKLCEAIGKPELSSDPRFKTNPDRVAHREELVSILEKVFSEKPRDYWVELLRKYGVPASPVYELDEVFGDTYVAENIVYELNHRVLGSLKQLAEPFTINGEKPLSNTPPPELGEHTRRVLRELGYSDEEINELIKEGVVKES